VYALLIGACIPARAVWGIPKLLQGLTLLSMYLLGIIVALFMAWVFKKTLLRGQSPMLIMELPPYKRPLLRVVSRHMWDRSKIFVKRAGTVILAINIILWCLATYPRDKALNEQFDARRSELTNSFNAVNLPSANVSTNTELQEQLDALDKEEAGEKLRHSYAGRIGRAIEPIIAPLGFDWKIGIGIVGSFAAREVFVSTMSTVYNVGGADETDSNLTKALLDEKRPDGSSVYTPLTAVTLMVFYVFALQCVSTVAIVRRETNSWKWPAFQWLYMGVLAWGLAFVTYHGGRWLGWM
jgi:ferrous iron transport protein B